MLEYQNFLELIKEDLQMQYGEDTEISLRKVLKNNGIEMDSITVREKDVNISPAIYLNDYYDRYHAGEPFSSILQEIRTFYKQYKAQNCFDTSILFDYDKVNTRIVPRIINLGKNKERLKGVPFMPFLDLAVVYYYLLEEKDLPGNENHEGTMAGILIQNEFLDIWKITEMDLHEKAAKNMQQLLPVSFCTMKDMLEQLLGRKFPEEDMNEPLLYVLSNQKKCFGAAWITDECILEQIYSLIGHEFYILPSSVHECMIVPCSLESDEQALLSIVQEINATQVDPQEVLSDHIYRYDSEKKMLLLL